MSELNPADTPYLVNTIRPDAAWFTNFFGMGRESEMNYVSLTSGRYRVCNTQDADPGFCHSDDPNIFAQLESAGRTWTDWEESMPADCFRGKSQGSTGRLNRYSFHHNPPLFYGSVVGPDGSWVGDRTKASCAGHVRTTGTTRGYDTSILEAALAAGQVSDLNIVVPNVCEDGHDRCDQAVRTTQYDRFLARIVPRIKASPAWGPRAVLIVSWDEGSTKSRPKRNPFSVFGGRIGLAIQGSLVEPGSYDATHQQYDLLRTLQDGLGLAPIGYLGNAATATAIDEAWVGSDGRPPNTTLTSPPIGSSTSTSATFTFEANRAGASFECAVDGGSFAACSSPFGAAGLGAGSHRFAVRARAAAGADATPAVETWTVGSVEQPPDTTITSLPIGTTALTSGTLTFGSDQGRSSFECRFDGAAFVACANPFNFRGLGVGRHTFEVRARTASGLNDPSPAADVWTITRMPLPETAITTPPIGATLARDATFDFTSDQGGTTFACSLDQAPFAVCPSQTSVSHRGLRPGRHTFRVRASTASGTDDTPAIETWVAGARGQVPDTRITTVQIGSTASTTAYFTFSATRPSATFACSLDGGPFRSCRTVALYSGLKPGSHTFRVQSTTTNGTDPTPAIERWTVSSSSGTP